MTHHPLDRTISRREMLGYSLKLAGGAMLATAIPVVAQVASPIAETNTGRVRGATHEGIHSFRGIPYGASTGGQNRWLPPKPATAWTGVRDALDYGPRAPQNERPAKEPHLAWIRDTRDTSEDCLALNVFTPAVNDNRKRPVLVYIHGGGFVSGASSAPGLDGHNFARRGDVVLVSLNHRLNLFGHLSLAESGDARYADAGNVGLLDVIQALQWVRDNIANFGGDPGNVSISGQSGGASKVAVLMAMPGAQGLFHKAIIQSASSLLRMATPEAAARNTHHLLTQLGLDVRNVNALLDVPAATLLQAMPKAVAAAGRIDNYRPVLDGRSLAVHPFDPAAPAIAANVPLMIGSCETEMTFPYSQAMQNFTYDEAQVLARIKGFVRVDDAQAARLMAVYRQTRPNATPGDLWVMISTDHQYRGNGIKASELKSALGKAPSWHYLFTWKTPVLNGLLKSPHTICIPFSFGNVDIAAGITGTGADRYPLQERMMDAWHAFMRSGNPNHRGLPQWKPYDATDRPTMIFDNACRLTNDPARDERLAIMACPPYSADGSGRT